VGGLGTGRASWPGQAGLKILRYSVELWIHRSYE
jgi:hypothetical protein